MIWALAILVLLCSTLSVPALAAAGCTRASLQGAVDKYLDALKKGDPSLMPLAAEARYMENRQGSQFGQGVWKTPLAADFNRSLLDVESCETFTEIIHTSSSHPYVVGTRLRVVDNKIAEVESLVTDKNDWLFNAADYLKYSSQEKWDLLTPEKRSDRRTLLNAANAYFDTFGDYSQFNKVPWGTPCVRIEGGAYTNPKGAPNPSCTLGMPTDSSMKIVNRHFLVDVDMGAVVGIAEFDEKNRVPDAHTFRLENGKLRYVHTMTVCTVPNCGFPPLPKSNGGTPQIPQ